MFKIATARSKVITCQERLFPPKKSDIVFPSELNSLWLEDLKKPLLSKIKILYVGRLKIEFGIEENSKEWLLDAGYNIKIIQPQTNIQLIR